MIFHRIELENFRQFYGKQHLSFSKDRNKNVTVIHGENGSGKTALLNAFTWCFYGATDFENADKLVNERQFDEAEIEDVLTVKVRIGFENDGTHYEFTRTRFEEKTDTDTTRIKQDDEIRCFEIGDDGVTHERHNPVDMVNQILPKRMYPYFFFNGERIDKLSQNESSGEIRKAIKNIMGLEIVERSITHLAGSVKRKLRKDLKRFGNIQVKEKIAELEKLEEEIKQIDEQILLNRKNCKAFEHEKEDVLNQLRHLKDAKQYQERRDKLNQNLREVQAEIVNINRSVKQCVSKWGFTAFSLKLMDDCQTMIDEKREKKEIPAGIKKQFVQDLIESGVCICNTELEADSEALKHVRRWHDKSCPQEVEDAVNKAGAAITLMRTKREEMFSEIRELINKREMLKGKQTKIIEELSEISKILSDKRSEKISDLETKNKELESKIRECVYQKGVKDSDINTLLIKIKDLEKQIQASELKEKEFRMAHLRLEVCEELIDLFKQTMDFVSNKVKTRVSEKVNEIFQGIIKKDYWAEITDDYELQIYKKVGQSKIPVAKSTGENQVSSLSFIGGLADIARKQYDEQKKHIFFRGGIFPLIMDSPFGQLDPQYRIQVAQRIPLLAPQIIVLATESQWKGDVEAGMKPYISKERFLCIYTPKPNKKQSTNRKLVKQSEKYEYSEIREMRDDDQAN